MDDKKNFYRMNLLMNCVELDAFSTQKTAGSSSVYFNRLAEFAKMAPQLVAELRAPVEYKEVGDFLTRIDALQKQLLAVGSSSLMLEAENIAELARVGSMALCARDLFVLKTKVKTLCTTIEEARIDFASARTAAESPAAAVEEVTHSEMSDAEKADRPKAPLRVEPFEKVSLLIDNFEMDEALEMLCSLMSYTYSEDVDAGLVAINTYLRNFNYEASAAEVKRVLEIVRKIEGGDAKNAKKKILAIDDVPDVLNTVKSLLKNDYAVYGVTNHKAALKFLVGNAADLILLDIEMPDMNGFALLSVIRKLKKEYEKIPVFIVSGNISKENLKKAQDAGVYDFIQKPVDARVFLPKVKKLLG